MPRYWILPIAGLKQEKNQILVYVNGYAFQNAGIGKKVLIMRITILNSIRKIYGINVLYLKLMQFYLPL